MKEYLKSEWKALIVGILAYWIFYAANELYGYILIQTGIIVIDSTNDSWNWHPLLIFSDVISTLHLIAPGFLAGWFAKQKGIVNGVIVILVCYMGQFFVFSVNHAILNFDFYVVLMLLQQLIMPVTVGAVSGTAGQLQMKRRAGL